MTIVIVLIILLIMIILVPALIQAAVVVVLIWIILRAMMGKSVSKKQGANADQFCGSCGLAGIAANAGIRYGGDGTNSSGCGPRTLGGTSSMVRTGPPTEDVIRRLNKETYVSCKGAQSMPEYRTCETCDEDGNDYSMYGVKPIAAGESPRGSGYFQYPSNRMQLDKTYFEHEDGISIPRPPDCERFDGTKHKKKGSDVAQQMPQI